ncbi:hypothetical protein H5V45_14195 [Nocardioides sp. KIGAM211]|uniref:Uncharacterized protein n=1 Tax=Nocardioides luti TaxID=2761101 RepID=A0A7X0RHL5_9ACTN|nr:hypothetical protein [Nocardioides luti]MBB6628471.1 hypothetical protein [Nocardioides luti]
MRAFLVVCLFGIISALTLLLLAGHGPWAGHTIWRMDAAHGMNVGDIPVLGMWGIGSLFCLVLLWRES